MRVESINSVHSSGLRDRGFELIGLALVAESVPVSGWAPASTSGSLTARNSPLLYHTGPESASAIWRIPAGHVEDFLLARWLLPKVGVAGPRCQMGNTRPLGLWTKATCLHPDARGSRIPGFLGGVKPERQLRPAIREGWICT
jgi:hypothetical protein